MAYNSGINQRVRNQSFFNNTINEDYSVEETNLNLISNLKYVQDYITNYINSVDGYLTILNPNFSGTMTSTTQGNINVSSLSVPTITSPSNFLINPTISNNKVEYNIVGEIAMLLTNTPPPNFILCNGSSLTINSYPKLFQLIGFSYGGSIETGMYNLPNFQSTFPIGANGQINNVPASNFATGNNADGALNTYSTTYNLASPVLDVIPIHNHFISDPGHFHDMNAQQPNYLAAVEEPLPLPCLKFNNPLSQIFALLNETGVKILGSGLGIEQIDNASNLAGVNISMPYVSTFYFICYQ
jgi:microcystin-dependent protein